MPYKWTPPPEYASLEHHGKIYYPGDMVPISKSDAEHMRDNAGHVWEGLDAPETPLPSAVPMQQTPTPKAD